MSSDSVERVNKDTIALWRNQAPAPALWPMLYEQPERGGFLSVGLNPSFSGDASAGWSFIKGQDDLRDVWARPREYYTWSPSQAELFDIDKALRVERHAREKHSFFSSLRQLHGRLSAKRPMPWHHLDIFAVRELDHRKLDDELVVRQPRNVEEPLRLTPFAQAQFALFERLLELSEPRLVIIFNSLASRIYRQVRSNKGLTPVPALGYCVDTVAGREVPVFFSAFPRYLDEFSRERLKWHVEHVLDATNPVPG
jgi:hypothetical protein